MLRLSSVLLCLCIAAHAAPVANSDELEEGEIVTEAAICSSPLDQGCSSSTPIGREASMLEAFVCGQPMPNHSLSQAMLEEFLENGVLVVPVLSSHEVNVARDGFHQTLNVTGVDYFNLARTAESLYSIGSGIGGIVEIFYPQWKLDVHQHPNVFGAIRDLWEVTYAKGDVHGFEQPYGPFRASTGHFYIDRAGFRLPDSIVQQFGLNNMGWPLQFGVHPHFDADPLNLWGAMERASKDENGLPPRWRPLQAFVSLTDQTLAETGGFEACPGFHKVMEHYFMQKPFGNPQGEFFPLMYGPHDDIINSMRHIPVRAGDLVVWDWKIPHRNAAHHVGTTPREVVYTGFLPDVPINQAYVNAQLDCFQDDQPPPDFWTTPPHISTEAPVDAFSALGMRLIGMVNCTTE